MEVTVVSEPGKPLEPGVRAGLFTEFLRENFAGQAPAQEVVTTAIQSRETPDPDRLISLDDIIAELGSATDWRPHEHGRAYNYLASAKPTEEHSESRVDWLDLSLPPGAETGASPAVLVLHRGVKTESGKPAYTIPWLMLNYYQGRKSPEGASLSPARINVLHFFRIENGREYSAVTRVYEAKPPVPAAP